MTKKLKDPENRAEQNARYLISMTKRLQNHENRAEHNVQRIDYFLQISEGSTYVCYCCGCLHFRKSVVILIRARLDSIGDQTIIDQVCCLSL